MMPHLVTLHMLDRELVHELEFALEEGVRGGRRRGEEGEEGFVAVLPVGGVWVSDLCFLVAIDGSRERARRRGKDTEE